MTINLFGFDIQPTTKFKGLSPVPRGSDEPSVVTAGGFHGMYRDPSDPSKQEFELIKQYRGMALHSVVDSAITEIIDEFVITNVNETPVAINLEKLKLGNGIKQKITDEFANILKMLDFDNKAHKIIRKWYIDGKIFYHNVVDFDNLKEGIQDLRYINSLHIRKRRIRTNRTLDNISGFVLGQMNMLNQNTKTFYEYNPFGHVDYTTYQNSANHQGVIPMTLDSVSSATSGLVDMNSNANVSYLHKARKVLNQLSYQEDAVVIYRVSRGPERRVFYVDTGNLPPGQAEQQLRQVAAAIRQQISYDSTTGKIVDDKKHMSILEDFVLPRRDGKSNTEITTLPAGQNLGELKDIEYFKKSLYNSLNLPPSRITDDSKGLNLGKNTEILRDELKFSKFIGRLRKDFSELFLNILKVHLVLKGMMTIEEWNEIKIQIQFDWLHDNHFDELQRVELLKQKLDVVALADPYIGRYFSLDYIKKQVLFQSENDVKEIDKQIKKDGIEYVDIAKTELDHSIEMDQENLKLEKTAMKQAKIAS